MLNCHYGLPRCKPYFNKLTCKVTLDPRLELYSKLPYHCIRLQYAHTSGKVLENIGHCLLQELGVLSTCNWLVQSREPCYKNGNCMEIRNILTLMLGTSVGNGTCIQNMNIHGSFNSIIISSAIASEWINFPSYCYSSMINSSWSTFQSNSPRHTSF